MRTREEIRAKYYKDCSIKEGWLVTTDEEYLLEEIFEAQNQAKNNEVLDLVMLAEFDVEPLQIWRHKENKECTLRVTKVHELSGATSVVFTGDVVEKYNKFLSPDKCGYTGRNKIKKKKKRFLNYELLKNEA